MFDFLRKLFGHSAHSTISRQPSQASGSSPRPIPHQPSANRSPSRAINVSAKQDQKTTDDYFQTMNEMQEAVSARDYRSAASLAKKNLQQLPSLVRSTKQSYGSFDIRSVPALEVGGTMLALVGDKEGLADMRRVVSSLRDLDCWSIQVQQHELDLKMFEAIQEAVSQNPGCRQTEMKSMVGSDDGRKVATLISWLEKAGKITREKKGKTYEIWLTNSGEAPKSPPVRTVRSHRTETNPPPLRELDVTQIPYVPLPSSPTRWEEAQLRNSGAAASASSADFEACTDCDWIIETIEKIPPGERPDTAFRQLHPLDSGLLLIDDLGNAEGLGPIPSAAIRYDRSGDFQVKRPLLHGIYRLNVNPMGIGLIAMSREAFVHAYDDALDLIFETSLVDSPEIRAIRRRFDVQSDQLKNHIRCVALSRTAQKYLFTVVDEAWCFGIDGRGIWGAKLPIQEGWRKIPERSETHGTSSEIQDALSMVGMSYPYAPDDVKRRYRELAREWHPDLNPGDPTATEKMKALTSAVQLLSGIDATAIPAYTGAMYARQVDSRNIEVDGQQYSTAISYVVSEIHAADWIYAASFGGCSDTVFLAAYSGRIIVLTENGEPIRAYDIGSIPRRIVDTGDYVYILTDTRLYVLQSETLHTIVDTFDSGHLLIAQTGFGLLEKKRFRWFREDGIYLGGVVAKTPIRRVYASPGGMVVETRTSRAVVRGAPAWWENDTP